jgi:large subunit ribosomal protein L31
VIHELKSGKNTVYTKLGKLLSIPSGKTEGRRQEAEGRRLFKFFHIPNPQSPVPSPSYNLYRFTTKGTMAKSDIHPKWYPDAKVYCNGQVVMTIGSTKPELHVDVWSGNHPFYTGTQKMIDAEGRVERFLRKYGMSSTQETGDTTK